MAQTLTEKILSAHLVSGTLECGKPVGIRIDQTLTQDATGTMTYLQFEAMGLDRVQNELAVSYVDHNTIQVGFENADDHRYLQSVAAAKGWSSPGRATGSATRCTSSASARRARRCWAAIAIPPPAAASP